ncbi:MAG TPA: hypothetical protein VM934_12935 [Pyrinomonadaceae bacterium]|nr:hypothetical protein [Pyrinomonadaceae bacterium]
MSEELPRMGEALAGALVGVERSQFMPAMSIELAVERYNTITEFISRVLRRDVDYGLIPGTDKLTLLKPGAEKLTTFFGLSTHFQLIERIEDWMGEAHNGEPFFYYLYRCRLYRGDLLIAEADGSCNSREQKYRYREAQRACPECGGAAIIKGREEYGGGWLCFRKKGGCGAKFSDGDARIESQQVGRIFNAEIADQVNTIQKMGQKRALVGATLLAVNASEFFTQDVEDMAINATASAAANPSAASSEPTTSDAPLNTGGANRPRVAVEAGHSTAGGVNIEAQILAACRALGKTEAQLDSWVGKKYGVSSLGELTSDDKRDVLSFLQSTLAKRAA